MEFQLASVEQAIEDIKQGKIVIVVDDEDRENEGDFVIAAEKVTPEIINFMMRYGRGVLCAPISETRAAQLQLPMQVQDNTSLHETPFTVTVDLIGKGCTTGVSMYDRAMTILALADPATTPNMLARPGHISPLRAKEKGVLRRAGHTEASVDLCKLAGLEPVACLIEVINDDGTMARLPQLIEIAKQFELNIITIKDLIQYRLRYDSIVEKGASAHLPTLYGDFTIVPFKQKSNGLEHIAIIKGDIADGEPVLVRVHSSCATGDIFGSMRCECGEQLHSALRKIEEEGRGVVIYLNQEGRGIGLMAKIEAYKLQEEGLDTVDANLHLGFNADERDYGVGASMLHLLGVQKMRLMSNNPVKRIGLEAYGLEVVENVPIEVTPNKYNYQYMITKKERMGHNLCKL
ncbi:3,4-dihydroxy-2-butanone 4-phosphate synthase [Porphyromonas sp. COT-108 OH2963]|uniref:bifunctional 3,4-dihydroxy-2-butanone-4-phosphate synthase/GTP cyclohydrolase II n=1 Tax=Porphyromonas sp. COT-108 OH2963 TaxID=1515614 RepID=UPI00052BE0F3|nr:bifunctional 3,4-dihydroxy-2-butanone-4-phosphate synthase/GTP cyclohydrolase II [Porphyromonas sp. COT-108 OH2963]KGN93813.1 3,4-dihydroxy-2-butanone 4-phosphate synthase [Porphyromonas sp. COT-108 OH2963]